MSGIDSLFHDRVVHDYSHTSEQVIVVYISSAAGDNSWLHQWFKPGNLSDEERENILWVRLVNGTKECLLFKSIFPSALLQLQAYY